MKVSIVGYEYIYTHIYIYIMYSIYYMIVFLDTNEANLRLQIAANGGSKHLRTKNGPPMTEYHLTGRIAGVRCGCVDPKNVQKSRFHSLVNHHFPD